MSAQNKQGDPPPWSGQGGPPSPPPMGPPPGGHGFGVPSGPPPGAYALLAKGSIRYIPVTYGGEVIGYLWASPAEHAAGFVRRLEAPYQTFKSPLVWSDRLQEAYAQGVPAAELPRRWAGEPEDPEGGGIAADAQEQEAASLAELYQVANPGSKPPPDSVGPQGFLPDGTPLDRSKGWGELSPFTLDKPGYSFKTDGAVRYLPVTKGGTVLGYLWASPTEDAADYQRRHAAGAEGFQAGGLWLARLDQCKQDGLPALDALRRWIGEPEDPQWGGIAADAQEREAPGLEALKEIADR